MNKSEAAVENEIQAKGLSAPRLTPAMIDDAMVAGEYHRFPGTTVTVCCLTLRNGFTVIGESACASPENFDEELGRKIAYDNARNKIWQLEGYLLRQRLHEATPKSCGHIEEVSEYPPHVQRMMNEKAQLDERMTKLSAFMSAPGFGQLSKPERHRLESQYSCMGEYSRILGDRITAATTN